MNFNPFAGQTNLAASWLAGSSFWILYELIECGYGADERTATALIPARFAEKYLLNLCQANEPH